MPEDVLEGQAPKTLNGAFLRNGPNPQHFAKSNRAHWFEGDGMIHQVRLEKGRVFYCNRYTETNLYKKESRYGGALYRRLGELFGKWGLLKSLMADLQISCDYLDDLGKLKSYTANTALCKHAKRVFALVEVDLPFELKVSIEVKSKGYDDFDG